MVSKLNWEISLVSNFGGLFIRMLHGSKQQQLFFFFFDGVSEYFGRASKNWNLSPKGQIEEILTSFFERTFVSFSQLSVIV